LATIHRVRQQYSLIASINVNNEHKKISFSLFYWNMMNYNEYDARNKFLLIYWRSLMSAKTFIYWN